MRTHWLSVLLFVVAGCGGSSPMCQTQGEGCTSAAPCCSGLNCTNGLCVTPGSGGSGGGGGGGSGGGGGGGGGGAPMCAGTGTFCTAQSMCCANLSCLRYSPKCEPGDIGDPCRTNGDCRAGLFCNQWCTKACTSNAECVTTFDSPAGVNMCISVTTGGFVCFPFCTSNAECTKFGTGLNCAPGTDPTGGSYNVCG